MQKPPLFPAWLLLLCLLITQTTMAQAPDDWKRFVASQHKNSVLLSWETFAEYDSREFMVQHSVGGTGWTSIGTVAAAGASGTVNSYKYIHATPTNGINFYRIMLVNQNGRNQFTKVIQVEFEEKVPIRIYPNPVLNGILNVQLDHDEDITIFTRNGKALMHKFCAAGKSKLYVNDLPAGLYQFKAGDEVKQFFIR